MGVSGQSTYLLPLENRQTISGGYFLLLQTRVDMENRLLGIHVTKQPKDYAPLMTNLSPMWTSQNYLSITVRLLPAVHFTVRSRLFSSSEI